MNKGGVYGSFVLIKLEKGTSRKFPLTKETGKGSVAANKAKSEKSPFAYIKAPIAKFFGWKEISKKDARTAMTKTVKTKINGKDETISTFTAAGTTGASRAITVRFIKPETIGGKPVASVKIAVPSSHGFGDMVDEIISSSAAPKVAQIVSYSGRTITYATPYNSKTGNKVAAKK